MKRKFFFLLSLLLCAVVNVSAETYTDEPVSATWSMADGSTSVGIVSPDAAALSTSWAAGSNMSFYNVSTYFTDYKMSNFRVIADVSSAKKQEGSYVEWTFTPNPGLTFTPTNVSFNVVKAGTGDPSAYVDFIDGEGNEISLATKATIVRDNASSSSGINHSYSLSGKGAAPSSNAVTLRVYTGKHKTTKSVGFSDVVISGTVTGTTASITTYTIEAESSDITLGTVSGGNTYAADATAELTATALTGGMFVKWQIKNGEDYEDFSGNTANPLSVTVTADASYKAIFKSLYKITFAAGEGAEIGTNKNDLITAYAESSYTTPAKNSYISKTGYTATGWTDGTNEYGFGEEIALTGDIELKPIFKANTNYIENFAEATDVTWEFRRNNGGVLLNIENATGYYVIQQKIAGETVDLPIYIDNKDGSGYDGKRGKTNNTSSDGQTQVNVGSKFTIPAIKGMVIRINAANKFAKETSGDSYETTIGGVSMTDYLTESEKGIVYTYDGANGTTDIIFGSGFGYLYNIVITYPAASTTTKNIELVPGVWNADGARYAAYAFVDGAMNAWYDFTETDGKYTATISDTYSKLILVRMKGETTENNWDNKWNQTDDIDFTAIKDGSTFTIKGWGEGEGANSTYTVEVPAEPDTYAIASNLNEWNTTDDAMTDNGDGTWTKTYEGVDMTALYEFKVVKNGSEWIPAGDNLKPEYFEGNGKYNVTITYDGTDITFDVDLVSMTVAPAKELTTLSSTRALDFSAVEGLEAYVVSSITSTQVTATKITEAPAETGIILKKTGSAESFSIPVVASAEAPAASLLTATHRWTDYTLNDSYQGYVLSDGSFKKATGVVPAFKAFLEASKLPTAGARDLSINFGETTGINAVESATVKNGQFFNIAGQRVAQPTKGLYIVNGKKVVIK